MIESGGATVQIPIAMLEKAPEDLNENDVLMQGRSLLTRRACRLAPRPLPTRPATTR